MGLPALKRVQGGKEVVQGTAVAATARWMGMTLGGNLKDREIAQPEDERGSLAAAHRGYVQSLLWQDTLQGAATFEDLIILLGMAIKGGVVPVGVGAAKTWTFAPTLTAANDPDTYTLEFGDDTQAYEAEYVFAKSLEISGSLGQALRVSAALVGRQLTATAFTAALAARAVEDILTPKMKLSMDDAGGAMGTTPKAATMLDFTWRLPAHFVEKSHSDGNLYFTSHGEVKLKPELEIVAEFNATAAALRAKYAAGTVQLVRLQAEGSEAEAGTNKSLTIDGAYRITEFNTLDEREGLNIVRLRLSGEYDSTYAKLFEIVVVNGVAVLP